MARRRFSSGNNNGILGSGIFGFFGSTVQCDSESNSFYCNFVKFFNLLIMTLVIVGIIFYAYTFATGRYELMRGGGNLVKMFTRT